ADDVFFPQFVDFLTRNSDLAGQLIFELGQQAFAARTAVQSRNMDKLADLGFRFSVDKVSDVELDFADFARAEVKFVKIAADVLLEELMDSEGRLAPRSLRHVEPGDFAELARRFGVE